MVRSPRRMSESCAAGACWANAIVGIAKVSATVRAVRIPRPPVVRVVLWRMSDPTSFSEAGFHSRRHFLVSATALLVSAACTIREQPDTNVAGSNDRHTPAGGSDDVWSLFIGTYTKSGASRGIYHVSVHRDTLTFGAPSLVATCAEPSFLALSRDKRTLVAVNELLEYEGQPAGSVTAFRHEHRAGTPTLTPVPPVRSSRGAAPCYVSIDASGRYALVANYMGGNVSVLPIAADGSLGEAVQVIAHTGTGPNVQRQEAPHAHCIVFDQAQRFVVSADLGGDRLYVSRYNATSGKLEPAATSEVRLAPGAGPRHVAFSPDGRTLYCANELDSTLAVFAYDSETGALTNRQVLSTRPDSATGSNAPADLHVHPNGRTVYLSNRGDNTIAVFSVDATTGALVLAQTMSSGGNWPRNFTLTPDGKGLLVAHQRSDSVVAFRIDAATGLLQNAGTALTTPVPVCVVFA